MIMSKSKEEWKTYNSVFDQFTTRRIFELASKGYFHELRSQIGPGKEAIVFSAARSTKEEDGAIAVKLYRLETANFKNMYDYLRVDPRFSKLGKASVGDPRRRSIFAWTEREYRNLLIARDAKVRAPLPIAYKDNIMIMEFIGHGFEESPLLKKSPPDEENLQAFADECLDMIERFAKAGMVHGDLSEYNIINHDEEPVFIDFSHSMPLRSPNADVLLERDIKTVIGYFKKQGAKIDQEEYLKKLMKICREKSL